MNGLYDEIRIAIYGVWNRRWLALAIAWAVCILGWIVVSLQPNSYESEARILVEAQNILSNQTGISSSEKRKNVDKLADTIESNTNLQKVINGTDLGLRVNTDADMDSAVASLAAKIEVEREDGFFDIKASQGSPLLARAVVQKLIDVAQEENIAGDRNSITEELKFLDGQILDAQKVLSKAENDRINFETENLGLLPGVGSISQRIDAARSELTQIETQLVSAQSSLTALNAQLASESPTISSPSFNTGAARGGGRAAGALAAAKAELEDLRFQGFKDKHPDVVSVQNRIKSLTKQVASVPKEPVKNSPVVQRPNPTYNSLSGLRAERSATVSGFLSRKGVLEAELQQLTSQRALEPGIASKMEKLNRSYDVAKEAYDQFLVSRGKAELKDDIGTKTDAVKFRIIQKPSLPTSPSAPNRPLLLTIILFFGVGAGVGCAFAMGHLQTSFPTASRLERASGLPVIGSVSLMLKPEEKRERHKKLKLFIGSSTSLIGVFILLVIVEFFQRGLAA